MSSPETKARDVLTQDDHARGCAGREYECTCGYDDRLAAEIERLRLALKAIADFRPTQADCSPPNSQIAVFAKRTASEALSHEQSDTNLNPALTLLAEAAALLDKLERLSDRVLNEPDPTPTMQMVWAIASVENRDAVAAWRVRTKEVLPNG